jgi:hypothetical protein
MQTLFVVFFIIIGLFFSVWRRLNEFLLLLNPIILDYR